MNINPLIEASPAIQLHVAAAAFAFALSVAMIIIRKGTPAHKYVGTDLGGHARHHLHFIILDHRHEWHAL